VLALAAETGYDRFVIDLGLPGMDGLDLIGKCRAQESGCAGADFVGAQVRGRSRAGLRTGWRRVSAQAFCVG
jgi:CheY-like chemotaxis protein